MFKQYVKTAEIRDPGNVVPAPDILGKTLSNVGDNLQRDATEGYKKVLINKKYDIQADTAKTVHGFLEKAEKNQDPSAAMVEFNNNINSYREGMLKNTDPNLGGFINKSVGYYSTWGQGKIQQRINNVSNGLYLSNLQDHLNTNEALGQNNYLAGSPEVANQLGMSSSGQLHNALVANKISSTQYASMMAHIKSYTNVYQSAGLYKNTLKNQGVESAQKVLDKVNNAPDGLLDEIEKRKVNLLAKGYLKQYAALHSSGMVNASIAEKQFSQRAILNGSGMSPLEVESATNQFGSSRAAKMNYDVNVNANAYHISNSVLSGNFGEWINQSALLKDRTTTKSSLEYDSNVAAATIVDNNIVKVKNGDVVSTIMNDKALITQFSANNQRRAAGDPSALSDAQVLVNHEKAIGFPKNDIMVQTKAANNADIAHLDSLPLSEQMKFLAQRESQFKDTFNYYLGGVVRRNNKGNGVNAALPLIYSLYKEGAGTQVLRDASIAMMQKPEDLKSHLHNTTDYTDINTEVNSKLAPYFRAMRFNSANNSKQMLDIANMISKVAAVKRIDGIDSISDAADEAFNEFIGDRYKEHDGYIAPSNVDMDKLGDSMDRVSEVISSAPNNKYISVATPVGLTKDAASEKFSGDSGNWYWSNHTSDHSYVLKDALGYPIKYKGKLVTLDTDDLENPRFIDQYESKAALKFGERNV